MSHWSHHMLILFLFVDGHCTDFPVVNGLDKQQHVVVNVSRELREGELQCSMSRVSGNVNLVWANTNADSSDEILLENQKHYQTDNGDGTYNIVLTTSYQFLSDWIHRVVLKCMVSGNKAHLYPVFTTVELYQPVPVNDSLPPTVSTGNLSVC